ncbi:Hpt domain-containing protein [Massilia sp. CF038]|uniref:Hpt domain-containing protein n=1 Tax=Massilia sp. CF038 TaxID=1881045 RepID=UPI0009113A83|nr:Hpt domain-containing protein [Massilia sp. CF038]SHH54002.1 Hpt domain-containing protein [Massilia sp. CF038]
MSAPDLQGKVDLMAKLFRGRLPVRFEKMNEALAACQAGAADPQAGLTELHRLLHSLAGAAGTFGLDGLGQQAKEIEHQVAALLANGQHSDADLARIGQALHTLQSKN